MVCVTIKAPDQPAHTHSLIRAIAIPLSILGLLNYCLNDHHLEFLSIKGGHTGSSESTLVKMPHCWTSHAVAHIFIFQLHVFVVDSWVGDVVVTDYDTGVNAQYDLRLVSQGPEEHFNLTSTGSIVTTAKLDREAIDTYYIIIEAKDKGTPRLSGSGTLTVSVLDANDNAPYFNRTYSV